MPINKTKTDCSGCTACVNICPKQCIRMIPDSLGFKYPKVDTSLCINCDLCVKVCPFHKDYCSESTGKPTVYVGKSKDPDEVNKSQSGAAFSVLSDWILDNDGVVYGAGYTGHFKVIHKRATTKEERDEFRGSKYVQSDLGFIFKDIRQDLEVGRKVMFSGTPCQVAGLAAYIPERLKENLYLIDLVCHGVPSPRMWADYLSYLEKKEREKIVAVNFRDKSLKGWHSHIESFKFCSSPYTYTYTYIFYSHINLRYSCAECPFTNMRRVGDITIGDAWGIENTASAELGADNKGCSLFLINTNKGHELFDKIKNQLIFRKEEIDPALRQPNLSHPTSLHPKRDQFEQEYAKYGIGYVIKKYGQPSISRKIREQFSNFLPNTLKRLIKIIIK